MCEKVTFFGAHGRKVPRVEEEHYGPPLEVGETHRMPLFVLQLEVLRCLPHAHLLYGSLLLNTPNSTTDGIGFESFAIL